MRLSLPLFLLLLLSVSLALIAVNTDVMIDEIVAMMLLEILGEAGRTMVEIEMGAGRGTIRGCIAMIFILVREDVASDDGVASTALPQLSECREFALVFSAVFTM